MGETCNLVTGWRKHRRSRQKKFKFYAAVNCDGCKHTIAISKKGRFAVLDHDNIPFRRWYAWSDLGGELPKCVEILCNVLATIFHDNSKRLVTYNYTMQFNTYDTVLLSCWDARIAGKPAYRLCEYVASCIDKRRARRAKRERDAHKRS